MAHVIFWGVNLGLAIFVFGLIVDTAEIKRIGAPLMGVTLLVALASAGGSHVGERARRGGPRRRDLEPRPSAAPGRLGPRISRPWD